MLLLGIETSCDDTAAGVVRDGRIVLSNVLTSQHKLNQQYGGVVPEVASREQLRCILPVIEQALERAGVTWEQLDGLAVTQGPGLAGSLLVGLNAGKAVAFARQLPWVACNHMAGHVYANWLRLPDDPTAPRITDSRDQQPGDPLFPALCLVVSGGHTELVLMEGHGQFRLLGKTLDDAAGEAFDKVARLLGLPQPGGPSIQKAAETSDAGPNSFTLPRAWLKGTYNFSFSGLKTAVLHLVQREQAARGDVTPIVPDIAASFQEAVIEVLVKKTVQAAQEFGAAEVMVAGGVAANRELRRQLTEAVQGIPVRFPRMEYCMDNGAMIAAVGYFQMTTGARSGWEVEVRPNWPLANVG